MTAKRPPAGESLMNPLAQVKFKEGLASFNAGNLAAAQQILENALYLSPNHFDAALVLGMVIYQLGDVSGAAAEIQKAIAINPGAAVKV